MTKYDFELIIQLNTDENPDDYIDALYEAGCDEATPGTGEKGYLALSFTREAVDAVDAIASALENVRTAIPHANLLRVEPYLLNLSELAFQFGFTKQNIQKYARAKAANKHTPFPRPFIEGKTSYWSIYDVASWLNDEGIVAIDKHVIEMLFVINVLNLEIEKKHQPKPTAVMANKIEKILENVA